MTFAVNKELPILKMSTCVKWGVFTHQSMTWEDRETPSMATFQSKVRIKSLLRDLSKDNRSLCVTKQPSCLVTLLQVRPISIFVAGFCASEQKKSTIEHQTSMIVSAAPGRIHPSGYDPNFN